MFLEDASRHHSNSSISSLKLLSGSLLALSLIIAAPAQAQYVVIERAQPYVDINAIPGIGTVTPQWTNFCSTYTSNLSLPFTFPFDGVDYNTWGVSVRGWMVLGVPAGGTVTADNSPLNTQFTFGPLLAPWWDNNCGIDTHHGTVGTAPNRAFVVQWSNWGVASTGDSTASVQVWLYEAFPNNIEFRYGGVAPSGHTASAGISGVGQGSPLAVTRPCSNTGNCNAMDFASMVNRAFTFTPDAGPEVVADKIEAPRFIFLDATTPVEVTVSSRHGNSQGPFGIEIYASRDPGFSSSTLVGSSSLVLPGFATATLSVDVTVPSSDFGEESVYFEVVVDPANLIPEFDENNNSVVVQSPSLLLPPGPDLAVDLVRTNSGGRVSAGQMVTVYTTLSNRGTGVMGAEFAVKISTNPVISAQDTDLPGGVFNLDLGTGATTTATVTVSIPTEINSGSYYIGVLADSNSALAELDESNNGRATTNSILVEGGDLTIATLALPVAYLRAPYNALLTALGGDASYDWEVVNPGAGSLPPGIGLSRQGALFGRPTTEGDYTFTVRVTSGMESAERDLSISVVEPPAPLTIVSRDVPPAVQGQEYRFELVTTGGVETSSKAWSGMNFPEGISVSQEGALIGTPAAVGEFDFTVSVTDGVETASRDFTLTVIDNANLLIVPMALAPATFGEAYSAQLMSVGGVQPITWLLQRGELPDGINLSTSGQLSGTPMQVGTFELVIEARDASPGNQAARDVGTFELVVVENGSGDLVIETLKLEDAVLNEGYDASIKAMGGQLPYEWTLVEGRLPDGLLASISNDTGEFRIAGAPTTPGTTNLLVSVVDRQGLRVQRAFVLRVLETAPMMPVEDEMSGDGCGCTASERPRAGLSLLLLGLIGLVLRRRS